MDQMTVLAYFKKSWVDKRNGTHIVNNLNGTTCVVWFRAAKETDCGARPRGAHAHATVDPRRSRRNPQSAAVSTTE
jgi:hypothetical protein